MSDLSNMCFMCLNTRDELVDKSEENNTVHYLQYVIPELFIMDSKVTQQICYSCLETLHSFYKFKKMCLENSCRLRNNIKNMKDVNDSQNNLSLTQKLLIEKNLKSEVADSLLSPKKLQLVDVKEKCEVDNLEKCSSPDVISDNKNNSYDTDKTSKHFECSICNKRFSSKQYLRFHLKLHSGSADIHCEVCSKSFSCKSQLRHHMAVHTGTKDFECSVCNKKFKYPSNLRDHKNIHISTKKHKCSVCCKTFSRKCDLTTHAKIHLEKRDFECTICEKKFVIKSRLNTHLKIHTNVKDLTCTSKYFPCRSQLRDHMAVQTGTKDFECSVCYKKFKYPSYLRNHMKIHIGTTKT